MAPISLLDISCHVDELLAHHKILIFSKSTCPHCRSTKELFSTLKLEYFVLELDELNNGPDYQKVLENRTGQRTVPNVFINGEHLGGNSDVKAAHSNGKLRAMLNLEAHKYDYDLVVVGGGSGGLVAAKNASKLGKRVACFDYVKPSEQGSSWGLGGTCVNVGCIPKKFMHQAAILGKSLEDARKFGWEFSEQVSHNWTTMRDAIQDYIMSLNWGYKVQLRDEGVDYINSSAQFIDPHKLKYTKKGKESELTAQTIILAMGGRPVYPDIPGAKEYAITSDDIFSLPHPPGKTLCIGASYVSLECAGFLKGCGFETTVMVRSILLRGFDQQMAQKIGNYMEEEGVTFFYETVPTSIEKISDGSPGLYKVTAKRGDGSVITLEFNTILIATGRAPSTDGVGLDTIGIKLNKSGYIIADDKEQTSIPHIYAMGDILEGKLELTPLAIQTAKNLVDRLYAGGTELTDYTNVPTTVFTPLEYGCIGYTEQDALDKFGEENIEVYHKQFLPYEWVIPGHSGNICYAKLICHIPQKEKVIGFHVVGPNAGEITQGYSVAMKAGATKRHFDSTIGIHPTSTEVFTTRNRSTVSVEMKVTYLSTCIGHHLPPTFYFPPSPSTSHSTTFPGIHNHKVGLLYVAFYLVSPGIHNYLNHKKKRHLSGNERWPSTCH